MTHTYTKEARLKPDIPITCHLCFQEIPGRKIRRERATCYSCKQKAAKERNQQRRT
jgi:hypothetical protein